MSKKILITDEVHPLLIEGLRQLGFTVDYKPAITPAGVLDIIDGYEGLVVNSKVYVGREMLDKATKLKFMCRAGSGLEVFDLEYARKKGVEVFNSPEGNRNAVAEFALGALLGLMRNIPKANTEVHNYEWLREPNRGHELSGKTIGLIAFGNTAQAFAKLLRGFDVNILAYDKYYRGFTDKYVSEASLTDIYIEADILSLHLPLTPETTYMIEEEFLGSFQKPYWLINTSRGKVLQISALLKAIEEGKILGAALDVLENEKLAQLSETEKAVFNQLLAENRVILSPHIAGWTHESKKRIAEVLLHKVKVLYAA
ncbi:MAG TPA: NAD(P)-dependent oxidoreductase [Chitinophagales bacterium]|nr:NAD(P)-dependent oxidoreductase [Chitinophagales bacterium]